MEIVQIDFFEIEENDEYKKIIQKVVQTCFETEKLMNRDRCAIFSNVSKRGT